MKVIYSECSYPFWLDVADRLATEIKWQPSYWIASPSMEQDIRKRYPDAVFHSNLEAVRGISPPQCADLPLAVIDQPLLDDLASCQHTVLQMMDRMDTLGSFSYHERVRLYHRLLMYWLSVLGHIKPDIVIFSTIPHLIYDYILYVLCKKRGIITIMFEYTKVSALVFLTRRFEDDTEIISRYKDLLANYVPDSIILSDATERYLKALTGTYEDISYYHPFYKYGSRKIQKSNLTGVFVGRLFRFCSNRRFASILTRYILRSIKGAYDFSTKKAPPNYLKQKGKRIEHSFMTGVEYRLFRYKAGRAMRQLEAYYNRLVEDVDLSRPYIYVALSYQPERTTSPMGAEFVNQELMINLLSKSVPLGWYLYVKEHTTQFYPPKAFRAQCARSTDFYDDIVSLPNAKLVSMSLSTFELIDHAKAVAVVNGTAGWEAVNRRKPALVFGYPWYRGCEGVFHTPTKESCVGALRKIESGYEVDRGKVRLFIYALEQVGSTACVEPFYENVAGISYKENVEAITRALKRFWAAEDQLNIQRERCLSSTFAARK